MNEILRTARLGHCQTLARDIEYRGEADDAAALAAALRDALGSTCANHDTRILALAEAAAAILHATRRAPAEAIGAFAVLTADRLAERHGAALQAAARSVP
jgi:hypothetical protein